MYNKILIATDGSELAEKAVAHGLGLASTTGGQVVAVTITEMWSGYEMAQKVKAGSSNPVQEYEQAMADSAAQILSSVEDSATKVGVKCETVHLKDHHPAEGILETAKDKACDLIVMSSHGRRGVEKVLLGSVASEVLTHSRTPVLIVK